MRLMAWFERIRPACMSHKKTNVQLHDRMSNASLYISGEDKSKWSAIMKRKKRICSKTISMLGIWMTFYGVATLKGQISAHTKIYNEL